MNSNDFKAQHINACKNDFYGNGDLGRYIILPGSDGRAEYIANRLKNVKVKRHSRQHNLYLGTLEGENNIDVAVISSGMGCASMEVILYELIKLGGKRFLRIGTAGSLQNNYVKVSDIVIPTASIRDESSSKDYFPVEIPALPSWSWLMASEKTKQKNLSKYTVHFGSVHCKSTLYAREFFEGPLASQHKKYHQTIISSGALATEMETSQLFTMSSFFNQQASHSTYTRQKSIQSSAVLAICGDGKSFALMQVPRVIVQIS